jgi:anti-sigma regulatory factor (Ser/Thr protein kinase)
VPAEGPVAPAEATHAAPPEARRRWLVEIAGTAGEVWRARELAGTIAADLGLGDHDEFRLRVALHEAVANAVLHGCDGPEDRVVVRAQADGARLEIDVVDPGGRYAPPPGPRDPHAPRGRGNLLLASTTDAVAVDVRPGATTVRFAMRLPAAALRGAGG